MTGIDIPRSRTTPATSRLIAILATVLSAACAGSPTAPMAERTAASVSLSFSGRAPVAFAAPSRSSADTIRVGNHVLVISSVKLVMREAMLGTSLSSCPEGSTCDAAMDTPVIVSLPLGDGTLQHSTITMPMSGSRGLAVSLYRVAPGGGTDVDAALRAADPKISGSSIVVTGTFDGLPYTWSTKESLTSTLSFASAVLATRRSTNVTVRIDVTTWFRDAAGNLLDPRTAWDGERNQQQVLSNVSGSIRAFEDRDRDGDDRNG